MDSKREEVSKPQKQNTLKNFKYLNNSNSVQSLILNSLTTDLE